MNEFRVWFFIYLKLSFQGFITSELIASGGNDDKIRIFELDGTIRYQKCAKSDVLSLDARIDINVVVAGRTGKDIFIWFYKNGTVLQPDTENHVYSVMILNDTHFLAGYRNKIILWSLDLQTEISIQNTNFNEVRVLKVLKLDKIVIALSRGKIFAYSLKDLTMLSSYDLGTQNINIRSIDVLNRHFIVSKCSAKMCILGLNSSNSFYLEKEKNFNRNVRAIKILNESFIVLGGCGIGYWNLESDILYYPYQQYCDDDINTIEVSSSDVFITGHEDGRIKLWNSTKITIIKNLITTHEKILGMVNLNKPELIFLTTKNWINNMLELKTTHFPIKSESTSSEVMTSMAEFDTSKIQTTTIAKNEMTLFKSYKIQNTFLTLESTSKHGLITSSKEETSTLTEPTQIELTNNEISKPLTDKIQNTFLTLESTSKHGLMTSSKEETSIASQSSRTYFQTTDNFTPSITTQAQKEITTNVIKIPSTDKSAEAKSNLSIIFKNLSLGEFFQFESLDIGLIMDLSQLNLDMNDCLSNCSGN
ncbi:hypothetical protein BpHYR1_001840, partial [Brachionus plicatilis]